MATQSTFRPRTLLGLTLAAAFLAGCQSSPMSGTATMGSSPRGTSTPAPAEYEHPPGISSMGESGIGTYPTR